MAEISSSQIGFCGLGAMGGGMAINLARLGWTIHGYDIYTLLVDKLVKAGGRSAASPAEAAKAADILILMVINSAQVDEVLFNPEKGAVDALRKDATVIICTTTAPQYQLVLRKHLDAVGRSDIRLLDCPVSGGSIRAANGTLSIFSSGPAQDLLQAKAVLEAMSDPLYHIPGGISMGSIAKMCHQHQAATNIIMASEAMGFAAAAGLNTTAVFEATRDRDGKSRKGWSWMFENRAPHMLENDWLTVHSAVSIILKDVRIVTAHGDEVGFPLQLANAAQQLYIMGAYKGFTKEDDAGLVRLFLGKGAQDAVGRLASEGVVKAKEGITVETIADVMAGVHLASTRECLAFAKFVGMDLELLQDIVKRGAGASEMFEMAAASIITDGKITLRAVGDVEHIRDKLKLGLEKAKLMNQPLPMAAAALEQLNFELM